MRLLCAVQGLWAWIVARLLAVLLAAIVPSAAGQVTVTYRGSAALPATAVDQFGQSFAVTGVSGITYLGGSGGREFAAVLDNSDKVIFLDVTVNADASIASVAITRGLTLSRGGDLEGVAWWGSRPGFGQAGLFVADEIGPAVRQFDISTGALLRELTTPPIFRSIRPNLSWESLSATAGGDLWAANEEALTPDGPRSTPTQGSVVRLVRFANFGVGWSGTQQYAYITDPLHGAAIPESRSGLVDLAITPFGLVLSLERSFAFAPGGLFRSAIYEVDLSAATDVRDVPSLAAGGFVPAGKRRLWEGLLNQNLEGLAAARLLSPQTQSLVGVVDDADPLSGNRLEAFELGGLLPLPPPPPPTPCYANCTGDFSRRLDIQDFICFQNKAALGDTYADCTGDGAIDIRDFACFQNRFALGCS